MTDEENVNYLLVNSRWCSVTALHSQPLANDLTLGR